MFKGSESKIKRKKKVNLHWLARNRSRDSWQHRDAKAFQEAELSQEKWVQTLGAGPGRVNS